MHILVFLVVAMVLFGSFAVIDSFAMPLDRGMVEGVSWKDLASVAAGMLKSNIIHTSAYMPIEKLVANPGSCAERSVRLEAINRYIGKVGTEEQRLYNSIPQDKLNDPTTFDNLDSIVNLWKYLETKCGLDPSIYTKISGKLGYEIHELSSKLDIPKSLLQYTAQSAKDAGSAAATKFLSGASGVSGYVPDWVKNNAKWWSEGKITDQDFTSGLQYLVKEKIIKVPASNSDKSGSSDIPKWVKNVAKFWADGKTTAADFVNGIQYLITNNIIHVS